MAQKAESSWMEGRTRPVRVFLTDEEHAIVRAAAAKMDLSISRFAIEAVVARALRVVAPARRKKRGKR
jgi:uncharacterized protein (DUF1778 family)